MGPADPLRGTTVDWTTVLVGAVFEANGYWPDGGFWCSKLDGDNQFWESWTQVQTAGRFETRGVLLDGEAIFASGVVGSDTPPGSVTGRSPSSFMKTLPPSMPVIARRGSTMASLAARPISVPSNRAAMSLTTVLAPRTSRTESGPSTLDRVLLLQGSTTR